MGGSGETAHDLNGQILTSSADGIDSEGLVRASEGSFWISDEYGPHIVHFDGIGKLSNVSSHLVRGMGVTRSQLYLATEEQTVKWKDWPLRQSWYSLYEYENGLDLYQLDFS
jgi:hypothetical protein